MKGDQGILYSYKNFQIDDIPVLLARSLVESRLDLVVKVPYTCF